MAELIINAQISSGVMNAAAPTTVQATSTGNAIGQTPTTQIQRDVMPFDFTALPAGAIISKAELQLTIVAASYNTSLYAHRIVRTDCNLAYLCWNNYKSGAAWGTAGCGNSSTDYTTTHAASVAVATGFTGTKILTLTDMVKYAQENTGKIIWIRIYDDMETTDGAYVWIQSRYNSTESNRPKLTITYTPPPSGRSAVMIF